MGDSEAIGIAHVQNRKDKEANIVDIKRRWWIFPRDIAKRIVEPLERRISQLNREFRSIYHEERNGADNGRILSIVNGFIDNVKLIPYWEAGRSGSI